MPKDEVRPRAGGQAREASPEYQLIHRLRALTVELDLLGAQFAKAHRLHPTDIRALIALLDADRTGVEATPAYLGRALGGVNSATVTALVDRLERAGLVHRAPDPTDRRRVRLGVTTRAHDLGTGFFGPVISGALTELADYSPEDLDTVKRFLGDMTKVVGEVRRPAGDLSG